MSQLNNLSNPYREISTPGKDFSRPIWGVNFTLTWPAPLIPCCLLREHTISWTWTYRNTPYHRHLNISKAKSAFCCMGKTLYPCPLKACLGLAIPGQHAFQRDIFESGWCPLQLRVAPCPLLCSFINLMQLVRKWLFLWSAALSKWNWGRAEPIQMHEEHFQLQGVCVRHRFSSLSVLDLARLQEFASLTGNCSYYWANHSYPSFVGLPPLLFWLIKQAKKK